MKYRGEVGHTHERRAKRVGAPTERFSKIQVFERDGWRCQICGVKTPRSKMGTDADNAPILDHIHAFTSDRAANTLDNVQCSCQRCNKRKADGPAAGQVGLFTSLINEEIRATRRSSRVNKTA